MLTISRIAMYWRFALGLRAYLRHPVSAPECRRIIADRLRRRPENLLVVAKNAIYENRNSPYLKLLSSIGCEYGDFKDLVHKEGIETSLKRLARDGVYVTVDEFKGRQPAVRGSRSFRFKESDFDNPITAGHLEAKTGGSGGRGARTIYDLDHLAEKWAVHQILRMDAYDALGFPAGMWLPIMPGAGPVALLAYAKGGIMPEKWFSPVEGTRFRPSLCNRLGTAYIVLAGRLSGAKFPQPEFVALSNARLVARWMSETIRHRGGCYLATYVSAAVRVCQAARESGIDLTGGFFSVSSEPFTEAKKREIEASGAAVYPMYAFMEAGIVGLGCGCPESADDYHLLNECVALIQYRKKVPHAKAEVDAFLFTSLLPLAPKTMLNMETGDYGIVEERSCGCRLEHMGFATHIHHVRSFEKLTGEGMSFVGSDIVRIVEEVLPECFGGSSTSYQVVEEESAEGQTRISVLVNPAIGDVDEEEIKAILLRELAKGSDAQRMMANIWSQARILRVVRKPPLRTERGKQLALHYRKGPANTASHETTGAS